MKGGADHQNQDHGACLEEHLVVVRTVQMDVHVVLLFLVFSTWLFCFETKPERLMKKHLGIKLTSVVTYLSYECHLSHFIRVYRSCHVQ